MDSSISITLNVSPVSETRDVLRRGNIPMKLLTMGKSMVSIGKKKSLLPVVRKTSGEVCCAIYMVDFSGEGSRKKN